MPDIMQRIGHEVLVCDGALGTMLHRAGMPPGACPEQLNVLEPETIAEIHRLYMLAGSQCTVTNSFGGTGAKLAEWGLETQVESLNRAAVRLARAAGAIHILADVGPTGLVMEPLGSATFEEVYALFAEQIRALAAEGPDAILFETFTDIAEIRCAVLAAKAVCDLPLFASATFGSMGRMDLSGTDPETAAVILSAAGADVVGMNCGLGPEQMLPLVEQMAEATSLPLIVQPNAGMPRLVDGVTVFPGTPDEMGAAARRFVELGAVIVGSCCGSTPEFTGSIVDYVDGITPLHDRPSPSGVAIAGPRRTLRLGRGRPLAVIGERINPTGKPRLAESLRSGSTSIVRDFAAEQARAGADALDVNVGAAGVDAAAVLPRVVTALSGMSDLPLVLDTTDRDALEAALRVYPGRALVNSVNGGDDSLEAVLPLAARYGAAVVALALDDAGIPDTAEGREAVVERIRARASSAGLGDDSLLVDALVMTAATDPDAPRVTLDAMSAATRSGLATLLGVSNVSHGLPDRALLNSAFLDAAAARGLDAAIVNPNDGVVMEAVRLVNQARASGVPSDAHEASWAAWESALGTALADASERADGSVSNASAEGSGTLASTQDASTSLRTAVIRGDAEAAPSLVDSLVADGVQPDAIIGDVLTPAIQTLGDAYGRGEVFLPQLMVAADAMKAAVAQAKTYMPGSKDTSRGRVAFATVKGDIHSIGKDICVSLLESQGFDVMDLGVDVEVDTIIDAAAGADVVCLSALMTTTLRVMESAVRRLAEERASIPVLVGGAVVTRDWADSVGAGYSDDAPGCVREVERALAASKDVG